MRTAVLALTAQGAKVARRITFALPDADVYLSKRVVAELQAPPKSDSDDDISLDEPPTFWDGVVVPHPEEEPVRLPAAWVDSVRTFARISQAITKVFSRYDAVVCIMATGIVVRSIASLLKSKLEDPAVVVLDERENHVISLLSGHVGGANALTYQLAAALGSDPVITTASDVEGIVTPDALCHWLGFQPRPHNAILKINQAMLDGAHVRYLIDEKLKLAPFYYERLEAHGCDVFFSYDEIPPNRYKKPVFDVIITRRVHAFREHQHQGGLFLQPMRLIAGIGCRKNTSQDEIVHALQDALSRIGLPIWGIDAMVSSVVKRNEKGLLAAAKFLERPIEFFENGNLAQVIEQYGLRESPFVKKTIGVGNVAEAAALAEAGPHARIALGKTKYEKVTVALVWQKLP